MLYFGTKGCYLCINKMKQKYLKYKVMNTTTSFSNLSSMFASEESYNALMDMISEMDLELMDVCLA